MSRQVTWKRQHEGPSAARHAHRELPGSNVRREPASTPAEVLEDVKDKLKRGRFDEILFRRAEELWKLIAKGNLDDPLVLKGRCLVSEVREIRGAIDPSRTAVSEDGAQWDRLRQAPQDKAAANVSIERVRFIAQHARVFHYRLHKYLLAVHVLKECQDIVHRSLLRYRPCLGTRAQLAYYLGCAHRQLGWYDEANRSYGEAIDLYREKTGQQLEELRLARGSSQERHWRYIVEREVAFCRHRVGIVLGLGLGWVNYTRGFLHKALSENIAPAEVLLLDTDAGDDIRREYLGLLRGSILRCLAGRDKEQLRPAIALAQKAYERFTSAPYGHPGYATRAAWELSLGLLVSDRIDEAERAILHAEEHAGSDERWQSNVWLVKSRIARARGDNQKAILAADQAMKLAGADDVLGSIDALVARAEAFRAVGELVRAKSDLEEALHRVRQPYTHGQGIGNPKAEGVINLHLAGIHVAQKNRSAAEQCLREWRKVERYVEHRSVHDLALDVERSLDILDASFTIPPSPSVLTYDRWDAEMRAWLLIEAGRDGATVEGIAKKIGRCEQTIRDWLEELSLKPSKPAPAP